MKAQETLQEGRLLYRPREAALLLGVSGAWIYREIAAGRLPVVRLGAGHLTRVRREDLESYVKAGQADQRGAAA